MRLPEDVETIWQHHGKLAAIRYLHSEYQLGWRYATLHHPTIPTLFTLSRC